MMTEPTYSYRELTSAYIELKDERDELLVKVAKLQADKYTFAEHMYMAAAHHYAGVEKWECEQWEVKELDHEVKRAIQEWNEKQK
ncbi:MAG: hypothetical protein ACYTFK_14060 [Planctomycetota bacterium]|jgi:hypothetical protein